jgi:NitT/TauT family transport system substrate-binding protein
MVKIEDPKLRFAALAAGELDGVVSTLDTMTLYIKPDFQLAAVVALDDSKGGDGIVSKQDIATVADLKGRKVAFNSGSVSDFYLNYVLQEVGLTVDDIEAVNMKQDDAGAAFVAGQVDAAVTWEPWLSRAKEAPDGKVLVDSAANPGLIVDVLLFRKDILESRNAEIQNVVNAYWQAVEYLKSNPDESIEIMARNVGGWLEDPQAFADTLTGVQIYDQAMNQSFLAGTDAPGYKTAQFAIDLWTAQGRIADPLTAADIIDNSFIQE